MTARARRRRAAVLLALALACGGLAASEVRSRESAFVRDVGPLVPVVAARTDIPPGTKLDAGKLLVRQLPQRFVPPDTLADAEEAIGVRVETGIPAGGYITQGAVEKGGAVRDPSGLRPGERAVELAVAGGQALAGAGPGTHVDLLVTTEHRTFVAIEDAELLGIRQGAESGSEAKAEATLRLSLRQAVYVTAAQSFAREMRLVPRPPGEPRGAGRLSLSASDL
ncbi:MAG: Flp pilus assembly protein CpaB [Thermoleophilaceae bacterium]